LALTIDDLPVWPHGPYPDGYTASLIADKLISALQRHGLPGVFAFSNSKALVKDASLARILDRWVEAGHYVGNHTHSHHIIHDVSAREYMEDIERATRHLAPWIRRSPGKYFRYCLNHWGETEEKRRAVKDHLDTHGYRIAEVTTWFYEWMWDQAFRKCLESRDEDGIPFLRSSFLDFSIAQASFDAKAGEELCGREIRSILLLHNLPFVAEVIDPMLDRLFEEGAQFIPLEEAAGDPFYDQAATFVTDRFRTYLRKLAHAGGQKIPAIAPGFEKIFDRVREMAAL